MLLIFSTTVFIRHLWQLKKVVFLHWCLIRAVLNIQFMTKPTVLVNKICIFDHDRKIKTIKLSFLMFCKKHSVYLFSAAL